MQGYLIIYYYLIYLFIYLFNQDVSPMNMIQ